MGVHSGKWDWSPYGLWHNVTQSYQILQKPTTRATHLLQLMGNVGDMFDESSLQNLIGQPRSVLLLQIMEICKAIEEAGADQKALRNPLDKNSDCIDDVCGQRALAFEAC